MSEVEVRAIAVPVITDVTRQLLGGERGTDREDDLLASLCKSEIERNKLVNGDWLGNTSCKITNIQT